MSSQTFENRSEGIIEQDTVACRTSRWLTKGRDGSDEAKYWTGHLKFYPLASLLTSRWHIYVIISSHPAPMRCPLPVLCRRFPRCIGVQSAPRRYSSTAANGAPAYEEYDIAIVGGGPVGLALAGALSTP